jgi:hypothetical protein
MGDLISPQASPAATCARGALPPSRSPQDIFGKKKPEGRETCALI